MLIRTIFVTDAPSDYDHPEAIRHNERVGTFTKGNSARDLFAVIVPGTVAAVKWQQHRYASGLFLRLDRNSVYEFPGVEIDSEAMARALAREEYAA